MNLFIAQSQKYEGKNWWKWSVWIDGPAEDLDRSESVTYTLHPTFEDPVRTTTDRGSKFQLRCSGWGTFSIPVEIRLKDGQVVELEHELQFTLPEE